MPTLKLTPDTVEPGGNVRYDGSGFTFKRKVQVAIDGAGWTSNEFRPARDGTFHGSFNVGPVEKIQTVAARYTNAPTVIVATAEVTVKAVVTPPPPVDPLPTISNITTTGITQTGAEIGWQLSEPATGQVQYGTTTTYGLWSTLEPTLLPAHSQTLSGLTADTSYHFRIHSKDSAGQEAISGDQTFKTAAVVIVPPPVDPPPTGTRPWAAPVTTRTTTVPNSLNTTQLNDFLESAGNGVVINFPAGGSYALTQGIKIGQRDNVILDGNGSTIKMSGDGHSQLTAPFLIGWNYRNGAWGGIASHIEIRNFIVVGSASPVGVGGQGEEQSAFKSHSAQYLEVHHNTIRGVTSDAFQSEVTNSAHHWYHDNNVESCGRMVLTVGGGSDILCENNKAPNVGYFSFDVEPTPGYYAEVNGVTFRKNTCNWKVWGGNGGGFFSLDGSHTGFPINNIFVEDNIVTGPSLYTQVDNGGTTRNKNMRFTGNTCPNGTGGTVIFRHVDGLTIQHNSPAPTLNVSDCPGAVTSPNP